MLHPSYTEIMSKVNSDVEEGNEPVVNSRYSIVIATAKRARQLIGGDEALVRDYGQKPLSIAVEELYDGKIKILPEGAEEDEDEVEEITGAEETEAVEAAAQEEEASEEKKEADAESTEAE
jgi:DNA-directed RNA polymerase subunit omega